MDGCPGGPTILADGPRQATPTATDGNWLAWMSGLAPSVAIMACALPGCSGGPRAIATATDIRYALAVAGATVFWEDAPGVVSCPAAGNGAVTYAPGAPGAGLATDGANVYWTTPGPSTLLSCAAAGCAAPKTIAQAPTVLGSAEVIANLTTTVGMPVVAYTINFDIAYAFK